MYICCDNYDNTPTNIRHEMQKAQKEVKFQENRVYKELLKRGDYATLASSSKYSYRTVADVLSGHRRLTDKLKKALAKLLNDRKLNDQRLKEAAATNDTTDTQECSICHSGKCDNSCSSE